ncbi:MAG: glucosamine-6-phosphate deaminase [Candidatus Auribacterota bacterium]|jgi:glucosamine-6-phosphate deaminase|uniref:Glucosamine-6-phosphate deaminase n=1 Tax=Candidatus Auribacter fodinae TaxID=2093366 RepID=A0A3A4RJV4_9BACT|nr:MAG: glucosamine-6-phosphate deaminase [Candidatus Auribacter fodinae]
MKVIVKKTTEQMSREAAQIFADLIRQKPNCVLGLATGGTPVKMYQELIRMHKEEGLDFSKVITFNLDEYLGLPGDHDQSYRYFMNDNLFNHINIKKENTFVLNGTAKDPKLYCEGYEMLIKALGGIDIQLLGIGGNGHIAFNEPGSPENSRTRIVDLTKETIAANSDGRFFKDPKDVPTQALSMGVATIMEARKVVLIANKSSKADAIVKTVEGRVSVDVPASFLQKHKDSVVIVDEDAASKLSKTYA